MRLGVGMTSATLFRMVTGDQWTFARTTQVRETHIFAWVNPRSARVTPAIAMRRFVELHESPGRMLGRTARVNSPNSLDRTGMVGVMDESTNESPQRSILLCSWLFLSWWCFRMFVSRGRLPLQMAS